jgi:hypothetical protein
MASLEAAMAQLMHFIPESMRPNLTKGALKNEEAAEQTPPATEPSAAPPERKEDDKKS